MNDPFTLESPEPAQAVAPVDVPVGTLDLRHADCMDMMREFTDGYFDLAIVDPPYFETGGTPSYYNPTCTKSTSIKPLTAGWHIPEESYFDELYRVSKHQIIWGCNYYAKFIPHVARIV